MSECPHKQLKKQMVGEQFWYVCECGQKFRVEPWDGKVSVLAPPDPRKDLAALEQLQLDLIRWRDEAQRLADKYVRSDRLWPIHNASRLAYDASLKGVQAALAEMRGVKR